MLPQSRQCFKGREWERGREKGMEEGRRQGKRERGREAGNEEQVEGSEGWEMYNVTATERLPSRAP